MVFEPKGRGVWRTEDQGQNWTQVYFEESDHDSLSTNASVAMVATESGIFRSEDLRLSWSLIENSPIACRSLDWSAPSVAPICQEQLFISVDDGNSWAGYETIDRPLSVAIAPSDPQRLIVGGVNGAMWGVELGHNLREVNEGLFNSDFAHFAAHPTEPDFVVVGTQCLRGFFNSTDKGLSWTLSGDTGHCVMGLKYSTTESNVLYATDADYVYRSSDGGRTIEPTSSFPEGVTHPHGFAIHPQDSDALLVGTSDSSPNDWGLHTPRLVRTTDGGEYWEIVGAGLPFGPLAFLAVDYDSFDPNIVLVGAGPGGIFHDSSESAGEGLYISVDGGEQFQQVSGLPSELMIYTISFDGYTEGRILISTNHGVYRSLDGAQSWGNILLTDTIGKIIWHPSKKDMVFVSSGLLVLFSADGGDSWIELSEHPDHAFPLPDGGGSEASGISISSDGESLFVSSGVMGAKKASLFYDIGSE